MVGQFALQAFIKPKGRIRYSHDADTHETSATLAVTVSRSPSAKENQVSQWLPGMQTEAGTRLLTFSRATLKDREDILTTPSANATRQNQVARNANDTRQNALGIGDRFVGPRNTKYCSHSI